MSVQSSTGRAATREDLTRAPKCAGRGHTPTGTYGSHSRKATTAPGSVPPKRRFCSGFAPCPRAAGESNNLALPRGLLVTCFFISFFRFFLSRGHSSHRRPLLSNPPGQGTQRADRESSPAKESHITQQLGTWLLRPAAGWLPWLPWWRSRPPTSSRKRRRTQTALVTSPRSSASRPPFALTTTRTASAATVCRRTASRLASMRLG